MNQLFQSKLPSIGTTIFTIMSKMAADHEAINLGQGFPDFGVDPTLFDLIYAHLKAGHSQYVPMQGLLSLREWISNDILQRHSTFYSPANDVTITNGATESVYCSLAAFLCEGDEVILFEPAFDIYEPAIRLHHATPVFVKLNESFHIDWVKVSAAISTKTRMIILNSPHNPSGACLSEEDMHRLIHLSENSRILILSDEVYEHLVFDGRKHHSVLAYSELRKTSIAVYSFGKTIHATGWRLGYCVADESLMTEIRKVHQFVTFSANSTMQYAIEEYLRQGATFQNMAKVFEAKRDLFVSMLQGTGLSFLPCEGSYFVVADYSSVSKQSDFEFATWLVKEVGVAGIPLSGFYHDKTDRRHIRFCFAKSDDTLRAAAERLMRL